MNPTKDPRLQLKYSNGLGDVIASILHSNFLGWLTKFITGKDTPCTTCSNRAEALNILFPFKVWKFYFKDEETMITSLVTELEACGYITNVKQGNQLIYGYVDSNTQLDTMARTTAASPIDVPENYFLLTSNDDKIDNIIIRNQVFKLRNS